MPLLFPKPRPSLLLRAEKRKKQLANELRIRITVRLRDQHRCRCCGIKVSLRPINPLWRAETHHVIYRSHGGESDTENLVTLCAGCHAGIHAHEIDVRGRSQRSVRFIHRKLV